MALLVVPCVTGTEISPDHHGAYGRGELDRGSHLGHIFFWADVSRLWDPSPWAGTLRSEERGEGEAAPLVQVQPKGDVNLVPLGGGGVALVQNEVP